MLLEVYGHGGDLQTASERYGISPGQMTDLSANINPLGPPPGLIDRLRAAMPEIVKYPDPGHRRFISLLSERYALEEDHFIIGNGAAENMALALLALSPARVGIIEPCFSEYRTLAEQFGATVSSVYGSVERAFRADPRDIERLIEETELVFLGQPNNPNGVQYPLDELHRFAQTAERCGTYLVVDEAFVDFIPEAKRQTLLPVLGQYKHLILIRSMTKFYAIPGLRLGFALAAPELVARMRSKQVTWSVNALALIAGEICLQGDEVYEQATISLITEQRELLHTGLHQLGCQTWPGEANFMLVRLPEGWTAAAVQTELGRRGVLVRSCAMYPGLGERDIRIAVKGQAEREKLLTELTAVLGGKTE